MKKLTKHQKQYRKRKKEALRDTKTVVNESGYRVQHVARKPICVRVSQKAADKLYESAVKEGMKKWEMLTHMIHYGLRDIFGDPLMKYNPNANHLNQSPPETYKLKYKAFKGDVQLNYSISSTAWHKLDRHSKSMRGEGLGYSKAKIVDDLIKNYQFTSEAKRQRNREQDQKLKGLYEAYANPVIRGSKDEPKLPWEFKHGEWKLRRSIKIEDLTEQQLDEYGSLVEANNERLKRREEARKNPSEDAIKERNEQLDRIFPPELMEALIQQYEEEHSE